MRSPWASPWPTGPGCSVSSGGAAVGRRGRGRDRGRRGARARLRRRRRLPDRRGGCRGGGSSRRRARLRLRGSGSRHRRVTATEQRGRQEEGRDRVASHGRFKVSAARFRMPACDERGGLHRVQNDWLVVAGRQSGTIRRGAGSGERRGARRLQRMKRASRLGRHLSQRSGLRSRNHARSDKLAHHVRSAAPLTGQRSAGLGPSNVTSPKYFTV